MIFKGKIGVWFWLLLIGVNITLICGGIHEELKDGEMLELFFAFFLINIICVPMVIRNYVQIDGEQLIFVLGLKTLRRYTGRIIRLLQGRCHWTGLSLKQKGRSG